MKCLLHLDTASSFCSVALSCKQEVLFQHTDSSKMLHTHFLRDIIEKALNRMYGLDAQLAGISLNIGPGSFTGLRIGMSMAKAMCWSMEIPLIGLDSLSLLLQDEQKEDSMVLMGGKNGGVFYCATDEDKNVLKSKWTQWQQLLNILKKKQIKHIYIEKDKDFDSSQMAYIKNNFVCHPIKREALLQFQYAWKQYEQKKFLDIETLQPNYLLEFKSNN